MQFLVNKRAFKKLPKKYKAMLITAMKAAAADMYMENFAESVNAWAKMKKEYPNIKVKSFPPAVVKAMKKADDEIMAKYASKNKLFKEIYENQKKFQKEARAWSKMGEYGYIKTSESVK
jgi:TRAP-type mannitol/chloroaromatic compound transport system substrate-binding protein